jgi:hypothetical protein
MSRDPVLTRLSALLGRVVGEKAFADTLDRVQRSLVARPAEPQAWEPLPLDIFGPELPDEVKSCWVFVLRGGGVFGAERHPNSHQRTVALRGQARFEVFENGTWVPRPVAGAQADLDAQPAVSIPANTWHRITIGPDTFVSCSFHTVPAAELIEETPVDNDLTVTRQRLYHA